MEWNTYGMVVGLDRIWKFPCSYIMMFGLYRYHLGLPGDVLSFDVSYHTFFHGQTLSGLACPVVYTRNKAVGDLASRT